MTKLVLPDALSKLCNKLASEQMKPEVWRQAQALRHEFGRRIQRGESPEHLARELMNRLREAAVQQIVRNTAVETNDDRRT